MTPIEIMALILLSVATIKIVVIVISPQTWLNLVVKKIWISPVLVMIVSLILSGITLYYLLEELTIVQIFATMFFFSLLAAVGVSFYCKDVIKLADRLLRDNIALKKSWLYIIIWIALIVWGFKELFA